MQRHQRRWPWSARRSTCSRSSRSSAGRWKRPRSRPSRSSSAVSRSGPRNHSSSGTPKPVLPRPAISGGRSAANASLSGALAAGELWRQREAELDHAVIEERRAQLQRDGHRGDVALRQQVAGKVRLDVDDPQVGVVREHRPRRVRPRLVRPELAAELEREHLDEAGVALGRRAARRRRGSAGPGRASSAARAGRPGPRRARRCRATRRTAARARRARAPGSARSRRTPRRRRRRRARP